MGKRREREFLTRLTADEISSVIAVIQNTLPKTRAWAKHDDAEAPMWTEETRTLESALAKLMRFTPAARAAAPIEKPG